MISSQLKIYLVIVYILLRMKISVSLLYLSGKLVSCNLERCNTAASITYWILSADDFSLDLQLADFFHYLLEYVNNPLIIIYPGGNNVS